MRVRRPIGAAALALFLAERHEAFDVALSCIVERVGEAARRRVLQPGEPRGRVHLGAAIERRGAAPRILPDGRRFGAHFFTAFPRFGYPTRTPDIAGGSTALTLRAAPPRQGQHARAD